MAGKPVRRETPDERALSDRIARAKAGLVPVDVIGTYARLCAELAVEVGQAFDVVYDEWVERAGIREYDAGVSRIEAERLAYEDVVERLRRQGRLLP